MRSLPLLVLLLGSVCAAGCGSLPSLADRPASVTLRDTQDTRLGRAVEPLARAHPAGTSGIYPLPDAHEAFAARALLADAAERTLDVQYYIWHADRSGTLLFESLARAGDRGVRVRLLLDDNNTVGLDATLAALDAHPNIEVRLFNPFKLRRWRYLGYLTDFARLNRRMHNKSFTADNQATIIGGRNVGDEYFGAGDGTLFADLDVLAVGPVVDAVSTDFDRYWASGSSYPVARLLPAASPEALAEVSRAAVRIRQDPGTAAYVQALARTPLVRDLTAGRLEFEWARTRLVSDDPAKALGSAPPESMIFDRIKQTLGTPGSELQLVSPYFVPTADGVDAFAALAGRGVRVSVLTNALEATDVAAVHAGYAKRRKALLAHGVELFELRRLSADPTGEAQRRLRFSPSGSGASAGSASRGSSSASSLHAKTFSVDRARIFVGSFNFDPRSARLNTEMGFVIDSPKLAQRVADAFSDRVPAQAYEVRALDDGRLQWIERRAGASGEPIERRHAIEPGTTVWQRLGIRLLSVLPIEWLL